MCNKIRDVAVEILKKVQFTNTSRYCQMRYLTWYLGELKWYWRVNGAVSTTYDGNFVNFESEIFPRILKNEICLYTTPCFAIRIYALFSTVTFSVTLTYWAIKVSEIITPTWNRAFAVFPRGRETWFVTTKSINDVLSF